MINRRQNRHNIGRYRQIVGVFTKHGFGLLIDRLGIYGYLKIKNTTKDSSKFIGSRLSAGERLRLSLEELGPAFIKVGQILSTRQDIFPQDILEELKKLQDLVPPFSFSEVRAIIEEELGDKLENIYKEFEEVPVAAASISQVHRARLYSGREVAVKVQRPKIEEVVFEDLNILNDISNFVDHHTKYGKLYDFTNMVHEFDVILRSELDFTKEAENADKFKHNFANDQGITVPTVKWIYTTKHVLTMEYIDGIHIDNYNELDMAGINKKALAKKLATSICNQILRDGFFHADPHPGNIRVLPDETIVFLDLGMVGHIGEERKKMISDFFIGVTSRNSRLVIKSLVGLENMPSGSNMKKINKDIDGMMGKYLTLPLEEIKLGDLFYEVFSIVSINNIKIPREFVLLAKTLGTLQSLLEKLAPDLNALVVAKPITKKLLYQSISADKISNDIKGTLISYMELFKEIPSAALHFFSKMEREDFAVQLEIKEFEDIQKRLERVFNRVSFSVILLAISIIITGIIVGTSLSASARNAGYILNGEVLKAGLILAAIITLGLVVSMFTSKKH